MKTKFLTMLGLFALIAVMGLGTATSLSIATAKDAAASGCKSKEPIGGCNKELPGSFWDQDTCKCTCLPGKFSHTGGCCPNGKKYNPTTKKCETDPPCTITCNDNPGSDPKTAKVCTYDNKGNPVGQCNPHALNGKCLELAQKHACLNNVMCPGGVTGGQGTGGNPQPGTIILCNTNPTTN